MSGLWHCAQCKVAGPLLWRIFQFYEAFILKSLSLSEILPIPAFTNKAYKAWTQPTSKNCLILKTKNVCVYERERWRKGGREGRREEAGRWGREGRKEGRQKGKTIKGERDRQGDWRGDLARLPPEAHTDRHMESHRIGTGSVRNRNSGIRSELKVSKFQFLQLQNENTNFQPL